MWQVVECADDVRRNASQKCSDLEHFDFWLFASWFATESNSFVSGHVKVGTEPSTTFSFSRVLVCCAQLEAEELGTQVHGLSLKMGLCDDVVVGTGLIDMYSKCCKVRESWRVFNQMRDKNVVTWTSMVTGCAQSGQSDEAMILVREMLSVVLFPVAVSFFIPWWFMGSSVPSMSSLALRSLLYNFW